MNRIFVAVTLMLWSFTSVAQKKNKTAVKFAETISAAEMKKHLYIIASKEMEGRDTPSPGLEKAANYIEDHFKKFGLLPGNNGSYRQNYPLTRDSMTGAAMIINGSALKLNDDFQPYSTNYSGSMRFSELVFAGYGIVDGTKRNDYEGLDVAGKLVMILDGAPADYKPSTSGSRSQSGFFGKMNAAMKNGAVAMLVVYSNYPRKSANLTSNWTMNGYRASQYPFGFTISQEIAARLLGEPWASVKSKIESNSLQLGRYQANIDLDYSRASKTTYVSNVIGIVEGSDKKDEYVMVTAHYDHIGKRNDTTIFYGADDDGSGTTGVLEMAEAFAQAKAKGHGPRRTMVFMTVSGEEKGLWGSAFYADNPVFPLEKTSVDLNIDMIGRTATEYLKNKDSVNYVYLIGDDKLSSELAGIMDTVNHTYVNMKLDRKFNDPNDPNRFYFRSDHYNFAEKGVPILFYFNGVHADYHRATDTPDKINYPMMAKRTQLIFYTAWEMANREAMLKRDLKLEKPKGF